jgi:hypothetical protein
MTPDILEKFLSDSRTYFGQQQPEAASAVPPRKLAHPADSRVPSHNGSLTPSISQWPFDLMRRLNPVAKQRAILQQFVSGR